MTSAPTETPSALPERPEPWYRQRRYLVVAAAVVILLVTVLTDLPQNASRPVQVGGDNAAIQQVNALSSGCRFATTESFKILREESAPAGLSPSDRGLVPSLLNDDQDACSFSNDDIYNLADVEVPSGGAGRNLQHMVDTMVLWATSDALAAIEAIQGLSEHPPVRRAAGDLKRAEARLARDRALALSQWRAAERELHARLLRVELPVLPG